MGRALLTLNDAADRARACTWIAKAPAGTRVEFKASKRTLPQNDLFWGMLTDIARQIEWHHAWLTPDDWKLIFLHALDRELRVAPSLDGVGFVNLGRSSSDLSKEEMSNLIELMLAFGAQHNVEFKQMPLPQAEIA